MERRWQGVSSRLLLPHSISSTAMRAVEATWKLILLFSGLWGFMFPNQLPRGILSEARPTSETLSPIVAGLLFCFTPSMNKIMVKLPPTYIIDTMRLRGSARVLPSSCRGDTLKGSAFRHAMGVRFPTPAIYVISIVNASSRDLDARLPRREIPGPQTSLPESAFRGVELIPILAGLPLPPFVNK